MSTQSTAVAPSALYETLTPMSYSPFAARVAGAGAALEQSSPGITTAAEGSVHDVHVNLTDVAVGLAAVGTSSTGERKTSEAKPNGIGPSTPSTSTQMYPNLPTLAVESAVMLKANHGTLTFVRNSGFATPDSKTTFVTVVSGGGELLNTRDASTPAASSHAATTTARVRFVHFAHAI
jgi:hypothetical protein